MAYLIDLSNERLTVENFTVRILVILGACLIHGSIYTLLYTKFNVDIFSYIFVWKILPGALYTTGVACILLLVWRWSVNGGLLGHVREIIGLQ